MKAKLIVETDDGPVEADFDITTEEESVTIELLPTGVKIHTPTEPKLVRSD